MGGALSACSGNPHLHEAGHPAMPHAVLPHNDHAETAIATEANTEFLIKMDTGSYCRAGNVWGTTLRNQVGALYGEKPTNPDFVSFLRTGESDSLNMKAPLGRFYFGVNKELKDKFNSCFRTAYDRIDADKVLGHHTAIAAGDIGKESGSTFAQWPVKFFNTNVPMSTNWNGRFTLLMQEINDHAVSQIDFFEELLTVGSPADRQSFKVGFVCSYRKTMMGALEELKISQASTKQTKIDRSKTEQLTKKVTCDTPPMDGYRLLYNRQDDLMKSEIPGMFYANHPIIVKDVDDLGFRIFTAEEIYLRYYRRALHEVGLNLGKALYHGLMDRSDGVEYIRNLALAVEKPSDLKDFFAPGFLESFEHEGDIYLRDMLCEVDNTACPVIPVGGTKKKLTTQ
jgi:hypothetical protein